MHLTLETQAVWGSGAGLCIPFKLECPAQRIDFQLSAESLMKAVGVCVFVSMLQRVSRTPMKCLLVLLAALQPASAVWSVLNAWSMQKQLVCLIHYDEMDS